MDQTIREVDRKLTKRFDEIETEMTEKANTSDLKLLQEKLVKLAEYVQNIEEKFNNTINHVDQNEKHHEEAELVKLQNEAYSKRFNLLVHGLPENHDSAWETREEKTEIFKTFLAEGLKIEDPKTSL